MCCAVVLETLYMQQVWIDGRHKISPALMINIYTTNPRSLTTLFLHIHHGDAAQPEPSSVLSWHPALCSIHCISPSLVTHTMMSTLDVAQNLSVTYMAVGVRSCISGIA